MLTPKLGKKSGLVRSTPRRWSAVFQALALVLGLCFTASPLRAGDFSLPGENFRSMSMGNTGVSSAADNQTLFFNPAAMVNVQKNFFDLASGEISSSYLPIENAQRGFGAMLSSALKRADQKKVALKEQKMRLMGQSSYYQQLVDAGWNFAFALRIDERAYFSYDPKLVNPVTLFRKRDDTRIAGASVPFGLGSFAIGASFKQMVRTMGAKSLYGPTSGTDVSLDEDTPKGTAFSADLGFLVRVPGDMRFRAGMSILNANGLNFKDATSLDEKPEINLGVSIGPTVDRWRTVVALDYRDLLGEKGKQDGVKDTSFMKRLHLGLELGYYIENKTFSLLSLRAGANQGLLTYGAEMNFFLGRTLVAGYSFSQEDLSGPKDKKAKPLGFHTYYLSVGINSL